MSSTKTKTKYLVKRYLYICCKIYSTSLYTVMLSIYHSLYVVFSLQYFFLEEERLNATLCRPWERHTTVHILQEVSVSALQAYCHTKRHFGRKLCSAQFEGNWKDLMDITEC